MADACVFLLENRDFKDIYETDKPDETMVKLTNPSKLHSLGSKLEDGIKTIYTWYLNSK